MPQPNSYLKLELSEIYKEALRSVGFYKSVPGVSKPADLFRALHSYAVSRRAGEIFGYVDPNNLTKVNEGWSAHLRREMPAALRSRQGPLRIFQ